MSAVPPPGGFLSRLGGLFGGGGLGMVGMTPEQQAELQRAALFQAGLATLASAQQPGGTLGGSLFSGFQAGAGALQQGQQNALQSQRIAKQSEREARIEKQETERLKLDQEAAALKARDASTEALTGAGRGLLASQRPLEQFQLISRDPTFKAGLAQYGIDPATITTPEQARELGQQLAAISPAQQSANRFGPVNPGQFTPESVQRYAQTGNYGDLEPYVPPAPPQIVDVAGVQNVVLPDRKGGPPKLQPLSTLGAEASAAGEIAKFKKLGEQSGLNQAEREKRGINSLNLLDQLSLADPLIDVATGSAGGAVLDKLAAFYGKATDGAKAIGQLKVLEAALIQNQPRLEGPQSNADLQLYRDAAAQIGNPEVPREIKKDALAIIRTIQRKYAAQLQQQSQPGLPINQIQFPQQGQPAQGNYSNLSDDEIRRQLGM